MSTLINTKITFQSILENSFDKLNWNSYLLFKNACISGCIEPSFVITPQLLAILFLDLGQSNINKKTNALTFILYTRRFSLGSIHFIQNTLKHKFCIEATLSAPSAKKAFNFSPTLNLGRLSTAAFSNLVKPFIPHTLLYKLKGQKSLENTIHFETLITITQEIKDILFGTMLGDGYLRTKTNGNSWHFEIAHSATQKDLVLLKYNALKPFCKNEPWLEKRKRIGLILETYDYVHLVTRVHPIFKTFGDIFYTLNISSNKYIKDVPSLEILTAFLTPRSIAIWFMDDGYVDNRNGSIVFCTESFSLDGVLRLITILEKLYNIYVSTQKRISKTSKAQLIGYRLYINAENSKLLAPLIKPFMLPSMLYKLPVHYRS